MADEALGPRVQTSRKRRTFRSAGGKVGSLLGFAPGETTNFINLDLKNLQGLYQQHWVIRESLISLRRGLLYAAVSQLPAVSTGAIEYVSAAKRPPKQKEAEDRRPLRPGDPRASGWDSRLVHHLSYANTIHAHGLT
jgi:hypothetical protein